jgi:MFS family permease
VHIFFATAALRHRRFIAGIGLGAEVVPVDTYLAEVIPAKYRGRMTAWAYTIGFLGVPLHGAARRQIGGAQ